MHSVERSFNWKHVPGNWDVLHLQELFPSDNPYGIPQLAKATIIPEELLAWGSRPQLIKLADKGLRQGTAVHFFLDDFRFESVWKWPERNVDVLMHIGLVLSPDFSLYRNMPIAMQIWQTYRNRWLGCYWQTRNIHVIPTISWSDPYDFCFVGVPTGSVVAISTVGILQDKAARLLFERGYERMLEVLQPSTVLCYGAFEMLGIQSSCPVVEYPSWWDQRRLEEKV